MNEIILSEGCYGEGKEGRALCEEKNKIIEINTIILPEGCYGELEENKKLCDSVEGLRKACETGAIVEGVALRCEEGVGIWVELGMFTGFIPWEEGALGLREGVVREIAVMSRIGRAVTGVLTEVREVEGEIVPILSRSLAQWKAREQIMSRPLGTVLTAVVTRLENFGVFVDIGCGVASLLSIDRISVSRIPHPSERVYVGQKIYVAILEKDWDMLRVRVTHKELLGTWEENARGFAVGMTIPGIARSVKNYGIFVELSPNFSGLAEFVEGVFEGERVSVYIKGLVRKRMKCKLLIIGKLPSIALGEPRYILPEGGRMARWVYPPVGSEKVGGETIFEES